MKKAPILSNETLRLQALLDYQVLDTPSECKFDQIVEMASKICGTPIALVSLVDSERQWFKAKYGLDASETPRDVSFCGHAIHQSEVFVVEDSLLDDRFSDNPLVVGGPQVRFYAGAPLISPKGEAIGTLCVIDMRPRELNPDQLSFLKTLSEQVIAQLELQKTLRQSQAHFTELQQLTKTVLVQRERLYHADKMAVLGEMASGLAHEINNPLAIISGLLSILEDQVNGDEPKDEVFRSLARVEETVRRISTITRALKIFSRDGMKSS